MVVVLNAGIIMQLSIGEYYRFFRHKVIDSPYGFNLYNETLERTLITPFISRWLNIKGEWYYAKDELY